MPSTLNPDALESALKLLRLHGFALCHYGGDALHQAVGAPTAGRTWRDDLTRACESIAGEQSEAAWRLGTAIETSLFDLNRIGVPGVGVARAVSDATCKAL